MGTIRREEDVTDLRKSLGRKFTLRDVNSPELQIKSIGDCRLWCTVGSIIMMDKQKRESPPFTSPVGRNNGFKIPKKKADDWCEAVHTSSPLTRIGNLEHRNGSVSKRPYSSSYESFNIPRNRETHAYYSSPGSSKFMRQPKVILTDILRSGSGRASAEGNVTDSNTINSISSQTPKNSAYQGSPENFCLSRTEQTLGLHKEAGREPEVKSSEKRTSLEYKAEQTQKASFSTVCRDVSNTPVSPQKELGVKKNNTEEGVSNVSKPTNQECEKALKKNDVCSPNTREKTYCYKRAEYQNKKHLTSPTNVSVHTRDKPTSPSLESVTIESGIRDRLSQKKPEPKMNSSRSYNRLRRNIQVGTTNKGKQPSEPIVLSSDEEEGQHRERVRSEQEQPLPETPDETMEDAVCDQQCPSPSDDGEPMDYSDTIVEPLPASDDLVLQLNVLYVYYGTKRRRAAACAKVSSKCIEIPIKVPLELNKCISLDTTRLQKYGFWLSNGAVSERSSAVIILWITPDCIPQIEKHMGSTSRSQTSKSNELLFLELVEPLSVIEQSLMCRIMREASESGGAPALADVLSWDEMYPMLEALSCEDCSFKANCGIFFKKQKEKESINTSPVDPPETYKDGRYSVSMVSRRDDTMKEVDKGGTLLRLLVYPPPPTKGGLAVTTEDLECLEHGEFLNDVIIDFYLKYLLLEKFPKSFAEKCHIFSSFFFRCLTRKDNATNDSKTEMPAAQRRHHRVKTWTRHVDIFTKDFIFVPVNENSHWYLVVVCFPWMEKAVYEDRKDASDVQDVKKRTETDSGSVLVFNDHLSKKEETIGDESGESEDSTSSGISCNPLHAKHKDKQDGKICKRPCLLIFDSLKTGSAQATVKVLREYLKAEWDVKRKTPREFSRSSMRDFYPKVPKQNNSTDCGLYVLQYVESFAQKPIDSFDPPMHLENWFPASLVKNKRDKIRDLILRLNVQQSKKS
ncbi:sentrin-specific protease 7 isoform X3 [Engystomops pustulosus]|uniref:sentrin-specific protease 7 isoform X3 n=1 Tax=Engystomops pustulosus TaxID=76066 RepID=UPI003AFA74D0